APDAFAFVEAVVENVVLAEVALGPMAMSGSNFVAAADREFADPIAALAGHDAVLKSQVQLHAVLAGNLRLEEEAGPGPAGIVRVGFEGGRDFEIAHGT